MNAIKIVAILLILGGVIGIVFGGLSYTTAPHEAGVRDAELQVSDRERVNMPLWVGFGAIVIGGALFVFGGRRG